MPLPSIRAMEPSLNRTVPVMPVSRSAKAARDPVIWLDAPVSRIQRFRSWSSAASKVAWIFCSTRWRAATSRVAAGGCAGVGACGGCAVVCCGDGFRSTRWTAALSWVVGVAGRDVAGGGR